MCPHRAARRPRLTLDCDGFSVRFAWACVTLAKGYLELLERPEPAFEQCKVAKRVYRKMVDEGRDRLDPMGSLILQADLYCAMGEALLALKEPAEADKALGRARGCLEEASALQAAEDAKVGAQLEAAGQTADKHHYALRRRTQEASGLARWRLGDLDGADQHFHEAMVTAEAAHGTDAAELIVLRRHRGRLRRSQRGRLGSNC